MEGRALEDPLELLLIPLGLLFPEAMARRVEIGSSSCLKGAGD